MCVLLLFLSVNLFLEHNVAHAHVFFFFNAGSFVKMEAKFLSGLSYIGKGHLSVVFLLSVFIAEMFSDSSPSFFFYWFLLDGPNDIIKHS